MFRYKAIYNGKKISGHINADDSHEAQQKLFKKELLITSLFPLTMKKRGIILLKKELFIFTSELVKLLQAGLSLFEVLITLEEKYRGHRAHPLLLDLQEKIKEGRHFSEALRGHPNSFDNLYISMIENAEKTGALTKALQELQNLLEKRQVLKKKCLAAIIYPSLLASFSFVVLAILLFYVIPTLSELFEGRAIHPFTAFILSVSRWANQMKGALAASVALFIIGGGYVIFSGKGKKTFSPISSHFPVVKDLFIKIALAKFCREGASLLSGSVPFLQAIRLSKASMIHPELEKIIEMAANKVEEGGKFSEILREAPLIPPLVTRLISIAEEGGNLPVMLLHIASLYEDEVEKDLTRLTQVLQPALLLFIGFIVGFVLLSILIPLTDVNSFLNT